MQGVLRRLRRQAAVLLQSSPPAWESRMSCARSRRHRRACCGSRHAMYTSHIAAAPSRATVGAATSPLTQPVNGGTSLQAGPIVRLCMGLLHTILEVSELAHGA